MHAAQPTDIPPLVPLRDGDRIVFFGDSLTEQGAAPRGYVTLFCQALAIARPGNSISVHNAGISGNRVPDLLRRVDRDVLSRRPTVVVVYIGVNDVWHGMEHRGTASADYRHGLRGLLQKLLAADIRTLLCTPSVIGEKTDYSNLLDSQLEQFAATSREVAAQLQVPVLDLWARFMEHLRRENPRNAGAGILTTDGVHFNDAGNRFVADCMIAALGLKERVTRA